MGLKNRYDDIRTGNRAVRMICRMQRAGREEGGSRMKGYYVSDGYMGYVNGAYRLFADESDYLELMREE